MPHRSLYRVTITFEMTVNAGSPVTAIRMGKKQIRAGWREANITNSEAVLLKPADVPFIAVTVEQEDDEAHVN